MRRTIYKFLFSLIFLMGVTSAWADDLTLFTTNFSTADGWTTESIITSSTTEATRTIKGTVISFKGYKTSDLTVAVGATATADGTLTFTGNNISASAGEASSANYYMAIPVSGVNGEVTVTTTGDATKWYYSYDDGSAGNIVDRAQASANGGFTITGLTKSNVTIYIGSNAKKLNSITITTPKPIKSQTVTGVKIGGTKVEGASFDATNTYVSAQGTPAAPKASIIKHIVYADDSEEDVDVDVTLAKNGEFFVGSATINKVVYTIKVPVTASNACQLTSILFSNSVYGAIAEPIAESGTAGEEGYVAAANGKVTVCYMAGTDAPTITTSSIKVSEAASYELKGNTITVTAEDETTTALYDIVFNAITPLAVNSDIEKTTFTEVPSWVSNPYDWSDTKGVKFAKAVDEANNMRIAKGFTRQYYFIGPAKSLTLTSMDAARAINVYVNGTKVDGITTTEKKGDITITLSETENNMVCIESNQTGGDGGFTDYAVVAAEQQAGPQPAEWESYELVLNKEGLLTADEIANKNETTFGIALDEEGNAIRVAADAADAIAVITGKYHSDHGMNPFSMKAKVPGAVKITAGTCSYGTCTVTVNGTAAGETVVGDNVNKTTCWKNNKDNVATGIYNGEAGEITITTGCYTPYIKIEKYVAPEPEPQPTEWESYELVLNKEGLLTAEEIANKNETTFGIALDEEGNAIRVAADAADAIAVITGKYHSDHGMSPFSMKAKVPGAVKITAGTCSYGTCTVTVNGTAAGETVVGDNVNKTTCWKNNKDNVATGIYNGEAGEITITTGCYTPYIKIEKYVAPKPTFTKVVVDFNQAGIMTDDEIANKNETTFGIALDETGKAIRVAADAADAVAVVKGNYHSEHGLTSAVVTVPVPAGAYKISIGTCAWGGTAKVKANGAVLTSFSTNNGTCYHQNKTANLAVGYVVVEEATSLEISGAGYLPFISIEQIDEKDIPNEHDVTFSSTDADVKGVMPAKQSIKHGEKLTIPANFTLYKEGYTLVNWTDGENTYKAGDKVEITEDLALTPIFAENTESIKKRYSTSTVTWNFGVKAGAPLYGSLPFIVTQASINGKTIDVKLDVDVTNNGKFATTGRTDEWAQVNSGTVFTVPSYAAGTTISLHSYQATTTTTINGVAATNNTSTDYSYTVADETETIEVVIGDGGYYSSLQAILPANAQKESTGTTFENEPVTVTWVMGSATPAVAGVVNADATDAVLSANYSASANWTLSKSSYNGMNFTGYNPAEKQSSLSKDYYIQYTVKPAKGVTLTPSSFGFDAMRFGTGGGYYTIAYSVDGGDEVETTVKGVNPNRNQDNNAATSSSITFNDVTVEKALSIKIYLYNLDPGKVVGFKDVTLNATANGDAVPSPILTNFNLNGVKYEADLIFSETDDYKYAGEITIGSADALPSESNPITATAVYATSTIDVSYPATNKAVISVSESGETSTYTLTVNQLTPYTVSYYDYNNTLVGTQIVDDGKQITEFAYGEADMETVAEGNYFRGWFHDNNGVKVKATTADVVKSDISLYALQAKNIAKNDAGYYEAIPNDGAYLIELIETANKAGGNSKIFLPNGTYHFGEVALTPITANNISIVGESMDGTIIINCPPKENEGIGTTATLLNTSDGLYLQDLTLKNDLDYYATGAAGRGVCLQDKGKNTICKNVKMLSYQDTYYSNAASNFYWEDSEIHGTVDYLCGDGDVIYNRCKFVNESRKATEKNGSDVLCAPYTSASCTWGYVFLDCEVESKCEDFTLARSWGGNATAQFVRTKVLDNSLATSRWTVAGMNVAAYKFKEFGTMDKDGIVTTPASNVVNFTHSSGNKEYETVLTQDEVANYTVENIFSTWRPDEIAAQAEVDIESIDADAAYLVEEESGDFIAIVKGSDLSSTVAASKGVRKADGSYAGKYIRMANNRGGFGSRALYDTSDSISEMVAPAQSRNGKYVTPTGIVIVKDGKKYTVTGAQMK